MNSVFHNIPHSVMRQTIVDYYTTCQLQHEVMDAIAKAVDSGYWETFDHMRET